MKMDPAVEPQDQLIRRLEDFFTEAFRSLAIMACPRDAALPHVLRAAELRTLYTDEHAFTHDDFAILWPARRESQDSLKYVLYHLYQHAPPGGTPVFTGIDELKMAAELLRLAALYSPIEDSLTLCRLGQSEVREGPANTFRFVSNDPDAEQRLSLTYPTRETINIAAMGELASRRPEPDEMEVARLIAERVGCIGRDTFYFVRREEVLGPALSGARRAVNRLDKDLPQDWRIGPYSLEEFWCFWLILFRDTMVQRLAGTAILANPRSECIPLNSPLLERSVDSFVTHMTAQCGLTSEVIRQIGTDLTYNPAIPWTDIMFQPLVRVADRLLVMPSVIEGSNAGRNLIALYNKVPDRKRAYDALSPQKEDLFLGELVRLLDVHDFKVRPRVDMGGKTDADLVAWRPEERVFLIVQAKWLYGPDSVREVLSHDQELQKGVSQAEAAVAWARGNPMEFLEGCGAGKGPINGLLGCVVSKVGSATCYAFSPDIPIVDFTVFSRSFGPRMGITEFHRRLQRAYQQRHPSSNPVDIEIKVPPYTFIRRGYSA